MIVPFCYAKAFGETEKEKRGAERKISFIPPPKPARD